MNKKTKTNLIIFILLAIVFTAYTLVVKYVDVKVMGISNREVGLSTINVFFFNLFKTGENGYNELLYKITDWGGVPPFIYLGVFGFTGLIQWIKRKNIIKVDINILALGIFFVMTLAVYVVFEFVLKINYRPVLIDGNVESSYPSSTTILSITLLISAFYQLPIYLKSKKLIYCLYVVNIAFLVFLIVGRIVTNVHWFTDILGAVIVSITLIALYKFLYSLFAELKEKNEKVSSLH